MDKEEIFFEMWKNNDPNLPKNITLKRLKRWCRNGSYGYPQKTWTEYLKEIGAYSLSEELIVKAIKAYHEEHGRYPYHRCGDASKYIGFKITWNGVGTCLRLGHRGLPGGSSLLQIRQKYFTGIEPPLTEKALLNAMEAYHKGHGKYPAGKSGDASKYIGFKITWGSLDSCLRRGLRGLPGNSSLLQLRQKHRMGIETPLTEESIVKAMKDYHEEHGKYPSKKTPLVLKDLGMTWKAVDSCLRQGYRGLPGKSSLGKLKKKYKLK